MRSRTFTSMLFAAAAASLPATASPFHFSTGQGPFNAAFTLDGATVPEPASWTLMLGGFLIVGGAMRRRNLATVAA